MDKKTIVVVGAGPAGMISAIRAAHLSTKVVLVEKNKSLGNKLLLSGKGRCNLTNVASLEEFILRFSYRGEFLRDAFKKFFNTDLIRFFESRGLKLKTERQGRVFPVTDRSSSIVEVLRNELVRSKVEILYGMRLKDIQTKNSRVNALLFEDGKVLPTKAVILATGGASYAFTGSTGDGFKIAERLGHTVMPLRPGLVPLETKELYPRQLKGLTLKNIRIKFIPAPIGNLAKVTNQLVRGCSDGKKQMVSGIGELLFTDAGITGPLILSSSGRVVDWLAEKKHVSVEIDLKPALSREQLELRLLREFKNNPRKNIRNILKALLPLRLIDVFLNIAKVAPQKQASQITQKERLIVIDLLKGLRFNIKKAYSLGEAMVTRGGVSLKEINPRTMESRLVSGLYFAGEIIDIDADTGGFNLQAAFSTGYLAGESAASA